MKTETHDINTSTAAAQAAAELTNNAELRAAVNELAQIQIVISEAQARQAAAAEAAKLAFAEATAPHQARSVALFASIEKYARAHRAELFPMKGQKETKTHKVLNHLLQFRAAVIVDAPSDAAARIIGEVDELQDTASQLMDAGLDDQVAELRNVARCLSLLLRKPPAEFDKEAFHALPEPSIARRCLAGIGITASTVETFKIAFKFTPEA